jgi:translation elongation factor EF-4
MSQRISKEPGQVSNRIALDSLAERIFALWLRHRSQFSIPGQQIVARERIDQMKKEVIATVRNHEVAQRIERTYSYLMIE